MPRKPSAKSRKVEALSESQKIQTEPVQTKTRVYLVDTAVLNKKRSELNPEPSSVYDQAQGLVMTEKRAYEEASLYIRETLKRAYKNYLMQFDEPFDPYTQRKKIFYPLTYQIVNSVAKPVNVTPESIHIQPITNESRGTAKIYNMTLPYFFKQMGFNELMDDFKTRVAWLGSQVTVQDWLYEEAEVSADTEPDKKLLSGLPEKEETKKKTKKVVIDRPRVRMVNLMDLFMPVAAESLPWAVKNASVILRTAVPVSEVMANPAYDEQVRAQLTGRVYESTNFYDSTALNRYAHGGYRDEGKGQWTGGFAKSSNPEVTLYERYGRIPKSWITGNPDDALTNVPGIITCVSESGTGEVLKCLQVRLSPFGDYGPFEECHFGRVPNRWYGIGLGELLIPLQAWKNEVINNRRNNELLVQNRMFIYKKGKVDPRYFTSRPGGGIPVEDMTHVQPLQFADISSSSYNEDNLIEMAAQKTAGAASTPLQRKATATEIENIQQNSNLTYSDLKATIERYVERLLDKHLFPLLRRFYSDQNKAIPIDLPLSELQMLDTFNGYAPFLTHKIGKERFLLIDDESVFDGEVSVTCQIEDQGISRTQQVQALTNAVATAVKIQGSGLNIQMALRKSLELQGIFDDRLFEDAQTPAPSGVTSPQMTGMQPPQLNPMQAGQGQIPQMPMMQPNQ